MGCTLSNTTNTSPPGGIQVEGVPDSKGTTTERKTAKQLLAEHHKEEERKRKKDEKVRLLKAKQRKAIATPWLEEFATALNKNVDKHVAIIIKHAGEGFCDFTFDFRAPISTPTSQEMIALDGSPYNCLKLLCHGADDIHVSLKKLVTTEFGFKCCWVQAMNGDANSILLRVCLDLEK